MVVGDGGVVVVIIPHCPAMWAFIVVKVAIDMACTVYVHAMSAILWWCCLLGTTTIVVVIVVDVVVMVAVMLVVDVVAVVNVVVVVVGCHGGHGCWW